MKITLLQTDIVWKNTEENEVKAERMILSAPGADLYVLPEMWSTGFITDTEPEAKEYGRSLKWMKDMASRSHAALCGSLAVKGEDGYCYNRQFFVLPDGNVCTYDKHHLFKYGGEDQYYQTGNQRTVVCYQGFRFLLITCYDLRFPVWTRYQGDYDAIICVANWPESRQDVWHILLRARAIENQCYVIGCNRVGDDPNCHYIGYSAVIDSRGRTIVEDHEERELTLTAEIDKVSLQAFRQKFRVLDDRDIFHLTPR
jgi:predicted amidohydrolase